LAGVAECGDLRVPRPRRKMTAWASSRASEVLQACGASFVVRRRLVRSG